MVHLVGRFADRLRHAGDWIAASCSNRGQRCNRLASRFGRRGPSDNCFSCSSGWQLDLETLVGLAYVFFGMYLIAHPALGVASLTLVLLWMTKVLG
jgi:hypothetical protein